MPSVQPSLRSDGEVSAYSPCFCKLVNQSCLAACISQDDLIRQVLTPFKVATCHVCEQILLIWKIMTHNWYARKSYYKIIADRNNFPCCNKLNMFVSQIVQYQGECLKCKLLIQVSLV